jgi:hypothetical protein
MSDFMAFRLHKIGQIDPFAIKFSDIDQETISHSLAQLARYGGHCRFPYSVGQHTCLLIDYVPQPLKRAAALHDWPESFGFVDIPRPVKVQLPDYNMIEDTTTRHLFDLMNEPYENFEAVKIYDTRICVDEMTALFDSYDPTTDARRALGVKIEYWPWERAKAELQFRLEQVI